MKHNFTNINLQLRILQFKVLDQDTNIDMRDGTAYNCL